MIVIHVMGGLGNQLYQYAMYEKLRSIGKNVKLDTYAYSDNAGDDKEWRKLELDRFPHVKYECCTEEDRTLLLDNSMSAFSRIRRKLTGRKDKTSLRRKRRTLLYGTLYQVSANRRRDRKNHRRP